MATAHSRNEVVRLKLGLLSSAPATTLVVQAESTDPAHSQSHWFRRRTRISGRTQDTSRRGFRKCEPRRTLAGLCRRRGQSGIMRAGGFEWSSAKN
jgi:hypothetical protein